MSRPPKEDFTRFSDLVVPEAENACVEETPPQSPYASPSAGSLNRANEANEEEEDRSGNPANGLQAATVVRGRPGSTLQWAVPDDTFVEMPQVRGSTELQIHVAYSSCSSAEEEGELEEVEDLGMQDALGTWSMPSGRAKDSAQLLQLVLPCIHEAEEVPPPLQEACDKQELESFRYTHDPLMECPVVGVGPVEISPTCEKEKTGSTQASITDKRPQFGNSPESGMGAMMGAMDTAACAEEASIGDVSIFTFDRLDRSNCDPSSPRGSMQPDIEQPHRQIDAIAGNEQVGISGHQKPRDTPLPLPGDNGFHLARDAAVNFQADPLLGILNDEHLIAL